MKITLKDFLFPPIKEKYTKSSSNIVITLLILGGLLYDSTKGYGTIISFILAFILMFIQKILMNQVNKCFFDLYEAKKMYKKTNNKEYLLFMKLNLEKISKESKIISEKGKTEIIDLENYIKKHI